MVLLVVEKGAICARDYIAVMVKMPMAFSSEIENLLKVFHIWDKHASLG